MNLNFFPFLLISLLAAQPMFADSKARSERSKNHSGSPKADSHPYHQMSVGTSYISSRYKGERDSKLQGQALGLSFQYLFPGIYTGTEGLYVYENLSAPDANLKTYELAIHQLKASVFFFYPLSFALPYLKSTYTAFSHGQVKSKDVTTTPEGNGSFIVTSFNLEGDVKLEGYSFALGTDFRVGPILLNLEYITSPKRQLNTNGTLQIDIESSQVALPSNTSKASSHTNYTESSWSLGARYPF